MSAGIDLMVGSNLNEWNFFMVPGGMIDRITPEMLAGAVAAYGLPVEGTLAAYRAARPGASAGELLSAIQGDRYFRIPALLLADAHAMSTTPTTSTAATYMYEFAWRSPQFNGCLGACPGLEIPFVFDVLSRGNGNDPLAGTNRPQHRADAMHAAWVGFAIGGECPWPKYDLSRRTTMRFDTTSEIVKDPRYAVRTLWAGAR